MITFKEYLEEARNPALTYTEKKVKGEIDRLTVTLEGNQSGKFTKLIKEYSKLKNAIDTLEEKQKLLNAKIKMEVEELYNAEDEILTRVVETVSASLNLSKKTVVTTTKVDYQKIIDQITALVPELTEQVNELVKANTKVTTANKSPALRVDIKESEETEEETLEEGLDWKSVKSALKSLWSTVKSWAKGYDKKLKDVNKLIEKF